MDTVTGNVWLDQTDATVPGVRTTLELKRSYNSALAATSAGREFGPGWSHGYENHITNPNPSNENNLALRLGDGRPLYFEADPAVIGKFIGFLPQTEQSYILKSATTPTTYTRRFPDGSEEIYNQQGRLISIADPVGVTTQLEYDPSTGRLTRIRDAAAVGGGRTLMLEYLNATATLVHTLSEQTPGQPVKLIATYSYKVNGLLESVLYADGDGDLQTDGAYAFTYGDNAPWWALTEVKDGDGKVVERHAYLPNGKGYTSEVVTCPPKRVAFRISILRRQWRRDEEKPVQRGADHRRPEGRRGRSQDLGAGA